MELQLLFGIIGGCIGFGLWVALLESEQMSGIIFRCDDTGAKIFTPQNILLYMVAPFHHLFFWYPPFLQHNWIIMTILGITGGISAKFACLSMI